MTISSFCIQDCIDIFHKSGLDEFEVFDYQLEAEGIVDLLKKRIRRKQYKPITSIHFYCYGNIYEIDRLIYESTDLGPYPKEFRDYDSIVEVLATASALGCYIDGYVADRGELGIFFKQDFNIDNITPEFIEFISRTVVKNDQEVNIDELIGKCLENNDIDLGMP